MKCRHEVNIIWSVNRQDPDANRVTCVDGRLSVRLFPDPTPPPIRTCNGARSNGEARDLSTVISWGIDVRELAEDTGKSQMWR